MIQACQTTSEKTSDSQEPYPEYAGEDLGLTYSSASSTFKIWSPTATAVSLHLYEKGEGDNRTETVKMEKALNGVWEAVVDRDLKGLFYTFQVETESGKLEETPGIYAKAVGVNGLRAGIIDLDATDPEGWKSYSRPQLESPNDIILYELHVRDITSHPSSGSSIPGKYTGLVEQGTKSQEGLATGIDHIKALGVTHVHLLPSFDHRSIDESNLDSAQFNWGYDPQNYNVPEGSYASDPYDPAVRIKEFKQMVKGFHEQGIRVILDVVYNHTGITENSNFNLEVPQYYYRLKEDGSWSDASACGNETASEKAMMRKFIIESCKYWVEEYHIDGFRFDLMGIHDLETMNMVTDALHTIDPSIYVYGEGWTAGESPLPDSLKALKANVLDLKAVAAFSDDLRDGIKGSVFDDLSKAFVNGGEGAEESIKFGVVASTEHPQLDYSKVNYSKTHWSNQPAQTISYVSCHDNHTLFDKLTISTEGKASDEEIKKMHKLANAIVLTSQGVPFLHAGVEMMRTKYGEHNSYNKPDSVNQILWHWKSENKDVFDYHQDLITLRKAHPAFRMATTEMISQNLKFMDGLPEKVVAYQINGTAVGDDWSEIMVIYNANKSLVELNVEEGNWTLVANGEKVDSAGMQNINGGKVEVPALSAWILYKS